jgi:tungstate transport system substrate-binding protein
MNGTARRRDPRRRAGHGLVACAAAFVLGASACGAPERLLLATTSSAYDSGLLDAIAAAWAAEPGVPPLRILVVGSGEALALGRRGDADVLLVHAPEAEAAYIAAGHGVLHRTVMRNAYVVAGPAADPAGVAAAGDATDALRRVAAAGAPFVSRGDDSGTHQRERSLWLAAGLQPWHDRPGWYVDAGQGMAETLRMASELDAYTLTDLATHRVLQGRASPVVLLYDHALLDNPYSVIVPAASRSPAAAGRFADWLSGSTGRAVIMEYGRDRYGAALFEAVPAAELPGGR